MEYINVYKIKIKSVNMDDLERKFEEPTKDNVDKGDFMVVMSPGASGLTSATYGLVKITNITKDRLESDTKSVRYGDAIVLKENGNYLVGGIVQFMMSRSSN